MLTQQVCDGISKQSGEVGVLGHGFTCSGHPAAAAVALETLKIYEERDILGHIASVPGRLQDGMRRFANHPLVGEVRGVGLIGAIELVKDKATRESFDAKDGVGSFRSEERRVGNECVRACRSLWSPEPYKKN